MFFIVIDKKHTKETMSDLLGAVISVWLQSRAHEAKAALAACSKRGTTERCLSNTGTGYLAGIPERRGTLCGKDAITVSFQHYFSSRMWWFIRRSRTAGCWKAACHISNALCNCTAHSRLTVSATRVYAPHTLRRTQRSISGIQFVWVAPDVQQQYR